MRMILASSFSNAFIGGVATWAFLTSEVLLIWAAVIAWGCFFHVGGNLQAVRIAVTGNCLGVFAGWIIGMLLIVNFGLAPEIWAGFVVFCVVITMVFIAHQIGVHLNLSSLVVPASFYGVAATVAYETQTQGILDIQILTSISFANPIIVVPISMVIGAFLGLATAKMTDVLATSNQAGAN